MREDHQADIPHTTDDAFEVTSLRPPAPGSGRQLRSVAPGRLRPLRRLGGRMSARGWRLLAAGAALVVTLAIILGMIPGVSQGIAVAFGRSQPAQTTPAPSNQSNFLSLTLAQGPTGPTPTPNPTPNPTTNPVAGSYPASCPGGVTTIPSATPFTGTLGGGPVWFGGFQSGVGQPAATKLTQSQSNANQYGMPIQVVLFIRSDTRGPVTINGVDLHGGRPLWFSFVAIGNGRDPTPGAQTPATAFSFTPQRPGPGVPTFWYASYGSLYLPGSGCYAVSARWPGGGWRITFVAGG